MAKISSSELRSSWWARGGLEKARNFKTEFEEWTTRGSPKPWKQVFELVSSFLQSLISPSTCCPKYLHDLNMIYVLYLFKKNWGTFFLDGHYTGESKSKFGRPWNLPAYLIRLHHQSSKNGRCPVPNFGHRPPRPRFWKQKGPNQELNLGPYANRKSQSKYHTTRLLGHSRNWHRTYNISRLLQGFFLQTSSQPRYTVAQTDILLRTARVFAHASWPGTVWYNYSNIAFGLQFHFPYLFWDSAFLYYHIK